MGLAKKGAKHVLSMKLRRLQKMYGLQLVNKVGTFGLLLRRLPYILLGLEKGS